MTDDEVIACLTTRMVSGFGMGTHAHLDARLAVRIRERHPVDDEGFMASDPVPGRIEPIEAVVLALRLLKPDRVFVPGFVDMPEAPYQRGYRFTPVSALPHRAFTTYRLDADDAERLVPLWTGLRDANVIARKPLMTATRRFGFAGERSRPDDQLLDLMIAGEAIFLAGEKTENRDKLSLRAALFLHALGENDPRRLVRFFRAAYDLRSVLAHGGEVGSLRPIDGSPATLADYTTLVSGYLRQTLRRMIEMAARGEPLPFEDWDEFTLGKLAPQAPE